MTPTDAAAPDVFISYARKNRPVAEQLAEGLNAGGLKVWWDSDLTAGSEFAAVIETKLLGAAVVIVLWSADSARSSFVRDESSRALKHDKLLPVRIEDIELPLGFGQLHTLDLLEWDGDADAAGFEKLLLEVQQRRQRAPRGLLPTPLPVPRRWPRRSSLMAAAALAVAAAAGVAWYVQDQAEQAAIAKREEQARVDKLAREEARRLDANNLEAERHFRAGLDQQIAPVPQLEKALNEYLSAIERRPGHARAHYYLAHIYAQTGRPADALASFKLALAGTEERLDRGQRAETEAQLLALAPVEGESTPVTRPPVADPVLVAASHPPPTATGGTAVAAARPARADTLDPGIMTRSLKPGSAAHPPAPAPVAAAPEAPRQPPHIDPLPSAVSQLTASVEGLFDNNKEARITATTRLVLDPLALSDAVPIAVDKALQVLKANPATLSASVSSGVVNTLVLLQSALPGTLQVNRVAIGQLIAAAATRGDYTAQQAGKVRAMLQQAQARHPLAYIQIAHKEQRPLADALAAKIRSFGYDAPAIELVGGRAPETTQVRVQGKSDRSYARWVAKTVGEATESRPGVTELRNARPSVDTYEIWLGRDLCAPSARVLAGCGKA